MRALAMEIVVQGTDESMVCRLANLARREVRRDRHPTTMRELVKDHGKARAFLAKFLLKRLDFTLIRPEFLPASIRGCLKEEKFRAAMVLDAD